MHQGVTHKPGDCRSDSCNRYLAEPNLAIPKWLESLLDKSFHGTSLVSQESPEPITNLVRFQVLLGDE